jgi:DNA-binding transcriptional regulator YdaS (Cro superfamily)
METLLVYLNAERGRRGKLAETLHVSPSAISMWSRVPGERLMDVSRATGISPEDLRPDMFVPALHPTEQGAS